MFFFFFKQKTAYEMRISDWSSDVCSSDLLTHPLVDRVRRDIHQTRNLLGVLLLIDVPHGFNLRLRKQALWFFRLGLHAGRNNENCLKIKPSRPPFATNCQRSPSSGQSPLTATRYSYKEIGRASCRESV